MKAAAAVVTAAAVTAAAKTAATVGVAAVAARAACKTRDKASRCCKYMLARGIGRGRERVGIR